MRYALGGVGAEFSANRSVAATRKPPSTGHTQRFDAEHRRTYFKILAVDQNPEDGGVPLNVAVLTPHSDGPNSGGGFDWYSADSIQQQNMPHNYAGEATDIFCGGAIHLQSVNPICVGDGQSSDMEHANKHVFICDWVTNTWRRTDDLPDVAENSDPDHLNPLPTPRWCPTCTVSGTAGGQSLVNAGTQCILLSI
jgi:hypothetical protein